MSGAGGFMKHILSLRGGGIRGVVPCLAIAKLEQQTGKLARESFDFVAGTSTGALLTAGIAAGIPASEMVKVYTERAKEIFTPSGIEADAKQLAVGYKYDPCNLYYVLLSIFGKASTWQINDSPIDILISATAMNGHNWFFVRDNAQNAHSTGTTYLLDAATASACAPTYFAPWMFHGEPFYDGGSGGIANPAHQVCVEAFRFNAYDPDNTRLVTLGTGYYPAPNVAPKGLLNTAKWVINSLLDDGEDDQDQIVDLYYPGIRKGFNIEMASDIDEADIAAIPQLVELGNQMAAQIDWLKVLA